MYLASPSFTAPTGAVPGDIGGGGSSREQELCGREAGEHVVEHGLEGLRDAEEGDGGVGRGRGDGEGAFCLGVEGVLGAGCENCGVLGQPYRVAIASCIFML